MPVLDTSDYSPRLLFKNGHLNTIFPYLFRKKRTPKYIRTRFITSDDDFVDLDFLQDSQSRLVILCHGLEGSSESQYIQHMASFLHENKWDVMAMNYRSCSGEMNLKLPMYHSGFTTDLHEIIGKYESQYDEIALVGISLGGNMVLKYTCDGIYTITPKIKTLVSISAPIDLSKSSKKISTWRNWFYDKRFRITLEKKMHEKYVLFPNDVPIQDLKKVKNLTDFDEYFTGPLHGFNGAEDYYAQCSSKQFLHNVTIPSLLITAEDDPFLSECSPFEIADTTSNLYFMSPKFGGHVGFTTFDSNNYWNEIKTLQFIDNPYSFCFDHRVIHDRM